MLEYNLSQLSKLPDIIPFWTRENCFFAARLTGSEIDDTSFTDLQKVKDPSSLKWTDRFKLWMQNFVQSAGFFGILLCASVCNCLMRNENLVFTEDSTRGEGS